MLPVVARIMVVHNFTCSLEVALRVVRCGVVWCDEVDVVDMIRHEVLAQENRDMRYTRWHMT